MAAVNIKLKSKNTKLHEEPDEIELFTEGEYRYQNGAAYYIYEETEISGLDGVKTTIKIKNKEASILRKGPFRTKLELIEKKTTSAKYETPYGPMDIEIYTYSIDSNIDEKTGCGTVRFEYYLNMMGEELNNIIELEISL